MDWFVNRILVPLLDALYVPFDWILGGLAHLPPLAAVAIVGAVSGVAVTLIQKYGSDQALLGRCKADLRRLKERIRESRASGREETSERLDGLRRRIALKKAWATLKPSIWTVPLIAVVALWTDARLGSSSVRPGDSVEVRAHFEAGASGYAHLLPSERVEAAGPLIVRIGGDGDARVASWTLRATAEGAEPLVVRHGGRAYPVTLPVAESGGRPPARSTVFNLSSPTQDQLQAVQFTLVPVLPGAWWNLQLQWGFVYLLAALAGFLTSRFLLKVH